MSKVEPTSESSARVEGLADLPRPVAVVLSGGASLGAIQAGQLRALTRTGLVPDFIVGTSVGAINGAFMARGFTDARADELAEVWRGIRRDDVFGRIGIAALARLARGGQALCRADGLEALLNRLLLRDRAELEIPMHAVAVEYLTGRSVVLSDGDLRRSVLASAAIPNVFPPVEMGGRLLVDGGLSANVPVLPAARLGAKSMVVLDAGFPCTLATPPRGIVAGILHALTLALRNQVESALPDLARAHAIVYLPAPCPLSVSPYDFSQSEALLAAGYDLASEFLASVTVVPPGVCGHPHFHPS